MTGVYEEVDFFTGQPYPMWARARAECPVMRTEGGVDPRATFYVTRHDDVERVLRDPPTFSSSINGEVIGRYMGDLILAMDGHDHRQYRGLVSDAFRASALERWERDLVGPIVDELLDAIAPLGRADLVRSVTSKYPVQVICGIVGVPIADHEQFVRWSEEINTGPLHPERGLAASRDMRAYLELRTGLNAILDRLPGLRLDPDAPAPTIQGLAFRGPDALPVRFDPSP